MKMQRNTLLAGVAALALVAGTGLASAQDQSKDHNGATPKTSQPHASSQPTGKAPSGPAGGQAQLNSKPSQSAQSQSAHQQIKRNDRVGQSSAIQQGPAASGQEKHAQNVNRGSKADKANGPENRAAQSEQHKGRMTSEREHAKAGRAATAGQRRGSRTNTAQNRADHNGLKGLQSNASGVNVKLSDEQRTQIRQTVIDARGAPKVAHVNFDMTVGTAIPHGRIHTMRVPETLVRIEPEWQGYLYFVFEDDVVIVNPRDMKIVAVLAV